MKLIISYIISYSVNKIQNELYEKFSNYEEIDNLHQGKNKSDIALQMAVGLHILKWMILISTEGVCVVKQSYLIYIKYI